uniref:Secreted protein n=1 Tax=Panagrolaimus sp. JU765 TaxID=591449 RepID=A0AC34QV12_9BILA
MIFSRSLTGIICVFLFLRCPCTFCRQNSGLMTGLIYNKPPDPLDFLENAIAKIRSNPELALKWDTFIDPEHSNENHPGEIFKHQKS